MGVITALKIQNPGEFTIGEASESQHILLVATTHLIFNNNRGDIKLASLMLMLNIMTEVKSRYESEGFLINTIFGGDFNSLPFSGIYHLMAAGYYDCKTAKRDLISG